VNSEGDIKVMKLIMTLKLILILPFCFFAQHKIQSLVISNAAVGSSTNTSQIKGTLGQPVISSSSISAYSINSGFWTQLSDLTTDVRDNLRGAFPSTYKLFQNYPNPFNPSTQISYSIPQKSHVFLKVYDMIGKEIATLVNESKPAGNYEVNFNASGLASGIYFYKLQTGNFIDTKKMILLR
jgi:hypothetical protein